MSEYYKFFQNKKCEYFPCHKGIPEEDFNCLFCYCMYVPIVPAPGAFVTGQRGRFVPNFPTGRKLSFFWTGAPVCPKEVPQRSICIITACPVFVRENQKFPIKIFHTKLETPSGGSHTPKKRAKRAGFAKMLRRVACGNGPFRLQ